MSKINSFTSGATTSGMMTWYAAVLDCGHWHYSQGWEPFPSFVVVGYEVDCAKCVDLKEAEERLEALDLSTVAYMRFSNQGSLYPDQGIFGQYHAYQRDTTSPTGVKLLCSFPATKAIDAIIDRKRICTMSPTEGR